MLVEVIALILLPVAIMMCAYSLAVFVLRSRAIAKKQVNPNVCNKYLFYWATGLKQSPFFTLAGVAVSKPRFGINLM